MNKKPTPKYDPKAFDRPSVTVDALVFTILDDVLKVALVKRASEPFKDYWALPGGFIDMKEALEETVKRKLSLKAGYENLYLEQLATFGDPKRDPRTRVITVVYFALTSADNYRSVTSESVTDSQLFDVKKLPTELAFDHKEIIKFGLKRLKSKIQYSNIAYGLLPKEFTLTELQKVYEVILGTTIDKRNFRKKMLATKLLTSTKKKRADSAHRPAELFRFRTTDLEFFN